MSSEPALTFRPARPQDAGMIRELVRAAYAKWVPLIGREPMPMGADYDRAIREHQIDLLSIDGRMAGLIETMSHPDHLWIENVAVWPQHHGKGLGRELLAQAERRAAEAGQSELRLLTNAAFEANVALYTKLGYFIDRQEPFLGGTTVYMTKKLER